MPELEIGLYRWDQTSYGVDLRFEDNTAAGHIRPRQSKPVSFNFARLRGLHLEPQKYGEALWDSLFDDLSVRTTFSGIVGRVLGDPAGGTLRVLLYISPNAPELHALRWEALRDPLSATWLATGERIHFSRYALSADWRPVGPAVTDPVKRVALVVIANPTNLFSYRTEHGNLTPVQVKEEQERAHTALKSMQVRELSELSDYHRIAGIKELVDGLGDGCDILYLACHGAIMHGEPILYLEAADRSVDIVTARALLEQLRQLKRLPRLVVLASCQSAGNGQQVHTTDDGALAALGPMLAEIGIPAVLAMQGNVFMTTIAQFMPTFFEELARDGLVDRAVGTARAGLLRADPGHVVAPDWWAPVLYLRLRDGDLWRDGPHTPPSPPFPTETWQALVSHLRRGKCTAILGPGLLEPLIGTNLQIARRIAETYRVPLAPGDRDDLPQVLQLLKITRDFSFPYYALEDYLHRLLAPVGSGGQRAPELALAGVILREGLALQEHNPDEAYKLLARLPFRFFITTNGDGLLAETLRRTPVGADPAKKKDPQVAVFRVDGSSDGLKPPNVETPWVYHLFGDFNETDTLVLTEDDYFEFLLDVSKRRRHVPSAVLAALTGSSLLFLGFRLEEWDFRVLVQSILSLEGSPELRKHTHVAVQLDVRGSRFQDLASARRYLEQQTELSGKKLSIYWGALPDFLKELTTRI